MKTPVSYAGLIYFALERKRMCCDIDDGIRKTKTKNWVEGLE